MSPEQRKIALLTDNKVSKYREINYSRKILGALKSFFGPAHPPLLFKNNEQLAIAVILSAQCTDERVNKVTPRLFEAFPDMQSLANAEITQIEKLIFSTGFYHNKAGNIKALAENLIKNHNGKIPDNFDVLIRLPGIGRKTANVIMAVAFNKTPGIVVDTHVRRITQLLGMTKETTPEKIEKDLQTIWPIDVWKDLPLYLIFLGRKFCKARTPVCEQCVLKKLCPSSKL